MRDERRPARDAAPPRVHGRAYHFCCAGCRTKFAADPERYLGGKAASAGAAPDAIYTCPMHPEVRQVGPGSCPICGMALEPLEVTADAGPNPELADMTRRFWVGLALALPVFALEMGGHLAGLHMLLGAAGLELAAAPAGDARSCSGPAGRSSSAAGRRSRAATSTCSR